MSDKWIPITEAIGRLAKAKGISSKKAIHEFYLMIENGRLDTRAAKVVGHLPNAPRRNKALTLADWKEIWDLQSDEWFLSGEAHFSDRDAYLGIEVHQGDLEREIGPFEPGDYTSWAKAFSHRASRVSLSEALSWIAFREFWNKDQLDYKLSFPEGKRLKNQLIHAVRQLLEHATQGKIRLSGKHRQEMSSGEPYEYGGVIPPEQLHDINHIHLETESLHAATGLPIDDIQLISEESSEVPEGRYWSVSVDRTQLETIFPKPRSKSKQKVISTAKAERQCEDWLREAIKDDTDNRRAKSSFKDEALQRYEGSLSGRGFERVWCGVAPVLGRSRPGRKSKHTIETPKKS